MAERISPPEWLTDWWTRAAAALAQGVKEWFESLVKLICVPEVLVVNCVYTD